jgi:hypothetical protein
MITMMELKREAQWTLLQALTGIFLVFAFLGIDGVLIADEYAKDSWITAIGIIFACPAGMTVGVWIFIEQFRLYLKKERFRDP